MYINRNTNKLKHLAKFDKRVFGTSELALLWEITNANTLRVTISRYVRGGGLYRLKRGLYSTVPVSELEPYEYGCAIAGPLSYVSAETVLSRVGAINQLPTAITLFGKKAREFYLGEERYICRYLNPRYLANRLGVEETSRFALARPGRALADLLHVAPRYYVDNPQLVKLEEGEDIYART